MSTDRLVFIPYARSEATDFIEQAERADKGAAADASHYKRGFSVVCYDDPGKPLEKIGVGLGVRILVAGHGLAGRPYISNSSGNGRKWYLPFNTVADRLIEKGLQKRYTGTIGCDVCWSGVKSDNNPPFADLLARYLHSKGYKLINTIGYYGPMGPVPEKINSESKFFHRAVDLHDSSGAKTKTVKSSVAQERYYGLKSVPKHLQGLSPAENICPPF